MHKYITDVNRWRKLFCFILMYRYCTACRFNISLLDQVKVLLPIVVSILKCFCFQSLYNTSVPMSQLNSNYFQHHCFFKISRRSWWRSIYPANSGELSTQWRWKATHGNMLLFLQLYSVKFIAQLTTCFCLIAVLYIFLPVFFSTNSIRLKRWHG